MAMNTYVPQDDFSKMLDPNNLRVAKKRVQSSKDMSKVCSFLADQIQTQQELRKEKSWGNLYKKKIKDWYKESDQLGNALSKYIDLEKVDQENYKAQF